MISNSTFNQQGAVNPNLLYLTCPHLIRKISSLEDEGAISDFQRRISADPQMIDRLRQAQQRHARQWLEAADVRQGAADASSGSRPPGRAPRIADARDDLLLKCLHAHFAFYLVFEEHPVGMMIERRIGGRWCRDQFCNRLMEKGES